MTTQTSCAQIDCKQSFEETKSEATMALLLLRHKESLLTAVGEGTSTVTVTFRLLKCDRVCLSPKNLKSIKDPKYTMEENKLTSSRTENKECKGSKMKNGIIGRF